MHDTILPTGGSWLRRRTVLRHRVERRNRWVAQTIDAAAAIVKNAFSPDGSLLAGGAGDIVRSERGEIDIWEAKTGQLRFRLLGHTEAIFGVGFHPSGRRLASASHDHTVKIWDIATGRVALTLRAHADTVRTVAFDASGNLLASASEDGSIKVWDASPAGPEKPPYQIHELEGASVPVFGVAFHPDGQHHRCSRWRIPSDVLTGRSILQPFPIAPDLCPGDQPRQQAWSRPPGQQASHSISRRELKRC